MIHRCAPSSKNPLACILLFVCLAVPICLLFGSCTKDEPKEVQKPGKIVRSIRKAIPPPSAPVKEETADTTQGIESPGPEDQSETKQAITDTAQTTDAVSKKEQP